MLHTLTIRPEQPLKEPHCCLSVSSTLQEYVNHLAVLVDHTPQIVLFSLDFHKDFVDEKGIAKSLVTTPESFRVLGPELDAP